MLTNGSVKGGLARGVDRPPGREVVVGLSVGDAQQVLDRFVLPAARIPCCFGAADRELTNQPRSAAGGRVDRVGRGGEVGGRRGVRLSAVWAALSASWTWAAASHVVAPLVDGASRWM